MIVLDATLSTVATHWLGYTLEFNKARLSINAMQEDTIVACMKSSLWDLKVVMLVRIFEV